MRFVYNKLMRMNNWAGRMSPITGLSRKAKIKIAEPNRDQFSECVRKTVLISPSVKNSNKI